MHFSNMHFSKMHFSKMHFSKMHFSKMHYRDATDLVAAVRHERRALVDVVPVLAQHGAPLRAEGLAEAPGEGALPGAARALVERFDIEPFSDFSAK